MLLFALVWLLGLPVVFAAKTLTVFNGVIRHNKWLRQELKPGSPSSLLVFDAEKCRTWTQQLESLGFVHLEDYLSQFYSSKDERQLGDAPPIADPDAHLDSPIHRSEPQDFVRLLVHPQHGCFAKIFSVSMPVSRGKAPTQSRQMIYVVSMVDAGPHDWKYSTTNSNWKGNTGAFVKLHRHARSLLTTIPDAPPEELLKSHLTRRAAIAHITGSQWKHDLSVEDNLRMEAASTENIRATYSAMTPLKMILKLRSLKNDKSQEWMGELTGRIN